MSTEILETYRALIQAVSAESSPYQEELLSALSALESGLQAHVNSVCQPAAGDGPQACRMPGASCRARFTRLSARLMRTRLLISKQLETRQVDKNGAIC